MIFKKVLNTQIEKFELKDNNPIKLNEQSGVKDTAVKHCDTDSIYISFDELIKKLTNSGIKFETEEEMRNVYKHIENVLQAFFDKILLIRAEKSHSVNKIVFNRENIFTNMFCFAKKLYIGNVIDSEGDIYSLEKPKHKIQGVPIKRSDSPELCKKASEELAFEIAKGLNKSKSMDFIRKTFDEFCAAGPEAICGRKSITDYTKFVPEPIEYYLKNGFYFSKGQTFNAKCALSYNYIVAKYKLALTPIYNGNKFCYVYVKPTNELKTECVAFVGKWPKEFNEYFEIDYERMFEKSFLPLFESMFKINKWIGEKEKIKLTENLLSSFFM